MAHIVDVSWNIQKSTRNLKETNTPAFRIENYFQNATKNAIKKDSKDFRHATLKRISDQF